MPGSIDIQKERYLHTHSATGSVGFNDLINQLRKPLLRHVS